MRAAALMLFVACHTQSPPDPGFYQGPGAYAPPEHNAQAPRFDPHAPPQTEALIGRWRHGKNQRTNDQVAGLSVDMLGHGGLLTLRADGSYTQITLVQTHPANCAISIVDWEQGSWTTTGNAINLQPAGARTQVIDYCNPSNNRQRPKQTQPASYTIQLGHDQAGDSLMLYLPDGRRHSGPYYREAT